LRRVIEAFILDTARKAPNRDRLCCSNPASGHTWMKGVAAARAKKILRERPT
jgi:hypothetical protein